MPKIFSSFLSGLNVISKKKKRSSCRWRHFFSPILCYSPKKKKKKSPSSKFCNFSPRFLRNTRARHRESRLSKVFSGKQKRRFLAGEKTPEFAKFQCENAGKKFALFALFCSYREHWPWPRWESSTSSDTLPWIFAPGHQPSSYFLHHVNKSRMSMPTKTDKICNQVSRFILALQLVLKKNLRSQGSTNILKILTTCALILLLKGFCIAPKLYLCCFVFFCSKLAQNFVKLCIMQTFQWRRPWPLTMVSFGLHSYKKQIQFIISYFT